MNSPLKQTQHSLYELPSSVLELRKLIDDYVIAKKNKQTTVWHQMCVGSSAYERWRAGQLFNKGIFDLAFSGLAAKTYLKLFDISIMGLPSCNTSQINKVSHFAVQLTRSLPSSILLPEQAQITAFSDGLKSLALWHPSQIQPGFTLGGDPARRWLIREIAEEFCYATNTLPTVAIISDLIRLGWPKVNDRSIRNTLTYELLENSEKAANNRRKLENQATAITIQALSKASVSSKAEKKHYTPKSDAAIIREMKLLASQLTDDFSRERMLSYVQAVFDESGFSDEENELGN
jgi:hypothetical protein